MAISDVMFDTISEIIDDCIMYFDEGKYLEMAEDEDIVEVIAIHLKIVSKRSFFRPTGAELARLESINWQKKARDFITEYVQEHYIPESESDSE